MRVFVTGASGWVGRGLVPELIAAGHEVTGLARSDAAARALRAAGAGACQGSLDDLGTLREAAAASDGVVHLAFKHDIAFAGDFAGGGRRGSRGPDQRRQRADSQRPHASALAASGVRSSIVRLPPATHGRGDNGFIPAAIGFARAKGAAAYVGDGANRWPAVHRDDAARLFRLALESAPAGSVLHAVGDEGVPIREVAEVFAAHLGIPAISVPPERAGEYVGFLGGFWGIDGPAPANVTRGLLGWGPAHPGLIADLKEGHYFA